MDQNNVEELPSNPIEAQGLLIKAVYKKFGVEVLPIIKDVCRKQGKSLGLKAKKKLPNNNLTTVAKAFSKSFDQNFVKIISISDEKFQIHGTKCPFGLENTSRELCEAVMAIDHEYFREAVSDKIQLKIFKTVAEGDPHCDTVYEIKR
ncbi:MAG: L-2-amino-thiazoline-4-carboxylic acid hydrolase [Candidatus Lokiarchaeota archaeon]|nr:L-2-amino-thiazoline-4-carboxylic acid hydrolase [Candidatus Lokiarchaeota archaeon]MCK4778705.1 L-2-amino-thiazoline-4-carboxylic acid hydrolase [Candidatus Lokiarchaeota archaeon]